MNHLQLLLFVIYVIAVYTTGAAIQHFLFKRPQMPSRTLFIGEALLLGSIWLIGLMLVLSLLHLYQATFLWALVAGQFVFLLSAPVRQHWGAPWKGGRWDIWLILFCALLGFFFFRNCYFLIDVDSHSTYLFAQKLWLAHKTSIFASPALDMKVFVPHFNAVPYALGLSLFPNETFFPQLITAFWTVIAVLLVFGYLSWRFNRVYGLAGVMCVLFNDHVFSSGANHYVIINSALIALLVGVSYNFLEARRSGQGWRLVLALIFLSQFLANKYQVIYIMFFVLSVGLLVQQNLRTSWRELMANRRWLIAFGVAWGMMGLWLLKNYLATGCPTFPILAGEMGVLNWSVEMGRTFNKVFGGPLSFTSAVKYFNYMFIWPGIHVSKLVVIILTFVPLIFLYSLIRRNIDKERLIETLYWLSLTFLIVFGLCLVSFLDPRHYRYGIGVMAIAAVVALDFILAELMRFPRWVIGLMLLVFALPGGQVMMAHGGDWGRPSIADNLAVLKDQCHLKDVIYNYYPDNLIVSTQLYLHQDKLVNAAWDTGAGGGNGLSAFLLPPLKQVGLWYTSAVSWDAYADPQGIVDDLSAQHISWVMSIKDGRLIAETSQQYAIKASQLDRQPKTLFYNYGFPSDLVQVSY